MSKRTDVRVTGARVYLLPVRTRLPLKFGTEVVTEVACARVCVRVVDRDGRTAEGWGETPLSVQWAWPSTQPFAPRQRAMIDLCHRLAAAWVGFDQVGHPIETGWDFVEHRLPEVWRETHGRRAGVEAGDSMPWLAALITASPFDIAIHDAFGRLVGQPSYATCGPEFMSRDLASFLEPAAGAPVDFRSRFPSEFLVPRRNKLRAWHLVGGVDPIGPDELRGNEPEDGYPVLLEDWIRRDGLSCLKVKLRGNSSDWDYNRLVAVGEIGVSHGVEWLSADFNCTVGEPAYVNDILDRLRDEYPRLYGMLLYVEQPFAYDLEADRIDVHSVAARKPLFLDESAHDWRLARLGRGLGWTGVALKTCKTQSGALLSLCWAKAHGMGLMVQDLTNPMLAQLAHLSLAAHTDTIMGVETNSMQFYPEASRAEAGVHPGCYTRRDGSIDLSTVKGSGIGYRIDEIPRELPAPACVAGPW
jgi:L-alanine-DL-glutamate epimerase-like enolase superfamily enzyme